MPSDAETSNTKKAGLPLRESGVECDHCGCTSRRPDSNRCAGCGRFAPDPIYARSPVTGTWYRVTDYDVVDDEGHIKANEKEEVSRDDVPEQWIEATEEAMNQ